MMIKNRSLIIFVLPALVLTLTIVIWLNKHPQETPAHLLAEPENCQLHQQSCFINDPQIQVSLSVTPRPVPIAKALEVTAHITGVTAKRVQLDINGSNMYMGYNRIDLTRQSNDDWTGKTLLAFCTVDKMAWQLTLMIDTATGEQIQAPFPLITPNQP